LRRHLRKSYVTGAVPPVAVPINCPPHWLLPYSIRLLRAVGVTSRLQGLQTAGQTRLQPVGKILVGFWLAKSLHMSKSVARAVPPPPKLEPGSNSISWAFSHHLLVTSQLFFTTSPCCFPFNSASLLLVFLGLLPPFRYSGFI
jgi:hypothetical protein